MMTEYKTHKTPINLNDIFDIVCLSCFFSATFVIFIRIFIDKYIIWTLDWLENVKFSSEPLVPSDHEMAIIEE